MFWRSEAKKVDAAMKANFRTSSAEISTLDESFDRIGVRTTQLTVTVKTLRTKNSRSSLLFSVRPKLKLEAPSPMLAVAAAAARPPRFALLKTWIDLSLLAK